VLSFGVGVIVLYSKKNGSRTISVLKLCGEMDLAFF
jgi:hypothetical protein